jgi:hypothetical protein
MTRLPVSYATAALFGFDIAHDATDFMETYERAEDSAIARELLEAEADAPLPEDRGFTYPCPLKDLLA